MHSFDFLALGQKIILDKGIHNEFCNRHGSILENLLLTYICQARARVARFWAKYGNI